MRMRTAAGRRVVIVDTDETMYVCHDCIYMSANASGAGECNVSYQHVKHCAWTVQRLERDCIIICPAAELGKVRMVTTLSSARLSLATTSLKADPHQTAALLSDSQSRLLICRHQLELAFDHFARG